IKRSFVDAKNRGVKLRYLTEITDANISYCKELMSIVDEVRHLDGIKGNFMVSEIEYLAPATSHEEAKLAALIIYSSVKEIVEHQQYVFETLWNKSISAEKRIRELNQGITIHYETKIIEDPYEIVKEISRLAANSNEFYTCVTSGGMHYCYNYFLETRKQMLEKQKNGEHKGVKYITNIDQDNAKLANEFLDAGIQIRHVKNLPPMSFGVSDKEIAATIERMEGGRMIQSLLLSNELAYVNHFKSVFEELWKSGIDARERIAYIEEGIDLAYIEVIPNAAVAREIYLDALKKAQRNIMILFPTTNAFLRQNKMGVIQLAKEAAEQRNVRIKILMPRHELTNQLVYSLTGAYSKYNNIDLRYIKQTRLNTYVTILIVDEKVSLVMEIRDDSKGTFDEAIGLSIYSNSRAGVLSYVSIFENLWLQTELYDQISESNMRLEQANEQLIAHDKMQKEFINIAAHELKTPIQPILSITQILRSQINDVKQQELLEITIRNAKRLQRLSNDILDVTKIEGKSLDLQKERFNLNDVVINAINDIKLGSDFHKKEMVKLSFNPDRDILIEADKARISQVISNLLSNAIEFTVEGTILVSIEKDKISNNNNNNNNGTIIVSVKDSGKGIDQSILPRLFTKFASKSYKGTGLGLFISKGIIEAHGGTIWGENNSDGRGATFTFSLPTN
ncbi:MAG TPA: HAMP domain-containing sensor histidine kinase, partial [Nitrososphaeraceae archaeon]|nr:HAMP domain-containing sensor histidine kinase [Nitrososphaeraceae archaeon]